MTVGVGSLLGPPVTGFRTGRKGSICIRFQRGTAVYSSSRVWLSLKENKSSATWIATRTGDDPQMDACRFLFPGSSCGNGEMQQHNLNTYKQEQRKQAGILLTADVRRMRQSTLKSVGKAVCGAEVKPQHWDTFQLSSVQAIGHIF